MGMILYYYLHMFNVIKFLLLFRSRWQSLKCNTSRLNLLIKIQLASQQIFMLAIRPFTLPSMDPQPFNIFNLVCREIVDLSHRPPAAQCSNLKPPQRKALNQRKNIYEFKNDLEKSGCRGVTTWCFNTEKSQIYNSGRSTNSNISLFTEITQGGFSASV